MIYLQQYGHQPRLGREEQAIMLYATLERIPVSFFQDGQVPKDLDDCELFVGSVESFKEAFKTLNVPSVIPNYYPLCLSHLLGRSLRKGTIQDVRNIVDTGDSIFAKPRLAFKSFTGSIFNSDSITSLDYREADEAVWLSSVIKLRSESRCYVLDHKLIACCQYAGGIDEIPDLSIINQAIAILSREENTPRSYCIDFGVTQTGQTVLIELGDGFAVGRYKGISEVDYYHFLKARWTELLSLSKKS